MDFWVATIERGLIQQLVLGCGSVAIVPLGFWGIWKWVGEQPLIASVFGWIIAYFVLVHTVTLSMYRYIHPVFPLILLAASHSLLGFRHRWHSSQTKGMDCEQSPDSDRPNTAIT
jgi:hypothetical protein